jgi:hypothetical protein
MITASEKEIIHKQFPFVHIVRTMKQKSHRHKYYMVEDRAAIKLLHDLRGKGKRK